MADYRKVRGGAASSGGGPSTPAFAAMSASDPDVVALWNFDEESGEFTDEVSSIVLTRSYTSFKSYLSYGFDSDVGGKLANIVPGFGCKQGTLDNASLSNDLDPGTGSFTMEFYMRNTFTGTNVYFYETEDGVNVHSSSVWYRRGAAASFGEVRARIYATDGSFATAYSGVNAFNLGDGQVHHVRLVYDAGNTIATYVDGVVVQSSSAVALAGKTVNFDTISIGGQSTSGETPWVFYQFRISHNATNNGYGLS